MTFCPVMHTLEKRGKSHYFSHVEDQGMKKHVYLGSDHTSALSRLAFLRSQRKTHDSSLYAEIDKVSAKLDRIAEFHRSPDDILLDMRKRHDRELHAQQMIAPAQHDGYFALKVVGLALLVMVGVLAFFPQLSFTGNVVADYDWYESSGWSAAWDNLRSVTISQTTAFVMVAALSAVVIGLFFGRVERNYLSRHDEYKHPLMRDKH